MPFVHKKTGRIYDLIATGLDCTNSRQDTHIVIYVRKCWWARIIRALLIPRLVFVREHNEWNEKFTGVK